MKSFGTRGRAGVAKMASGLPLILLALAAWVVLIAGVSVVRHEAGSDDIYGGLGYTWFVIAANFFVLLYALIHCAGLHVPFLANAHSGVVGLLAIVTTLDILETRTWNDARKITPYSTKIGKGAVTAFAGYLSLSVLNALLVLILGNHSDATRRSAGADVYQTTNVHANPVGTTPAVATV